MDNIISQYSRISHHTITDGATFSVPSQEDFTLEGLTGSWTPYDLVLSEIGVDESNKRVFIRIDDEIKEFQFSGATGSQGISVGGITGSFQLNDGTGLTGLGRFDFSLNNLSLGVNSYNLLTTGNNNVALGYSALRYNDTGSYNVALGLSSLCCNTSGCFNVAIGLNSLRDNTTGLNNVSLGYNSLRDNTTGSYNVALGGGALRANSTGCFNVSLGHASLHTNTTGNYNVALGKYSLYANSTGFQNIAIGKYSLRYNSTGNYNIALGRDSLCSNTTGGYNVGLGFSVQSGGFTGSVILGSCAVATAGCQLVLGSTTFPIGSVTASSVTASHIMNVRLNGEDYEILLNKL